MQREPRLAVDEDAELRQRPGDRDRPVGGEAPSGLLCQFDREPVFRRQFVHTEFYMNALFAGF